MTRFTCRTQPGLWWSPLVVLVLALVALTPTAAAAPSVRSTSAISCPAAPSGWEPAPAAPSMWGPAQNPGQNAEEVTCRYANGVRRVSIVAEYALPTDINPINDFYYGCNNTPDVQWTASQRVYLVASTTQWGYAELNDGDDALTPADVAPFESATQTLLKSSEGLGHGCKIDTTKPMVVGSVFLFDFEFDAGTPSFETFGGVSSSSYGNAQTPAGSFTAQIPASGSVTVAKVVSVRAPAIPMTVLDNGKVYKVTLRITHGIDYTLHGLTERLRADLAVTQSSFAGCSRGSTGTITITTQQIMSLSRGAAVRISLCGSLFSHGPTKASATIIKS